MGNQIGHDGDSIDQGPNAQDSPTMPSDQGSFEEQLMSMDRIAPPSVGQLINAVFIEMQDDAAIMSIGQKMEALIPAENMQSLARSEIESLSVGTELNCIVIRVGANNAPTILSVDRARQETEWHSLQETMESGSTLQGTVISTNRGGCLVKLNSLQGFVPLSQMSLGTQMGQDDPIHQENRIGQTLQLKVLEVDRTRNRIVLSERAAVNEERATQKAKLMSELTEGQLVTGHVSGLIILGVHREYQ